MTRQQSDLVGTAIVAIVAILCLISIVILAIRQLPIPDSLTLTVGVAVGALANAVTERPPRT